MALARAGAEVTGCDTNAAQLEVARIRAGEAGISLELVAADFNGSLPWEDGTFDAVVSRLAVMAADDPVVTLGELRRVVRPGGRLVTVLWASPEENPWFDVPRSAIAAVLGLERAAFARSFGRLGDPESAAAAHREAGLVAVEAERLHELRVEPSPAEYWAQLSQENGHFRRVAASLSEGQRRALAAELESRMEPFREGDHVALPRTLVLAKGRR